MSGQFLNLESREDKMTYRRRSALGDAMLLLGVAIMAAIIFFFYGCGVMQNLVGETSLTPEQQYIEARALFNSVYKSYLDTYDTMPASVQEEWKEKIDPKMKDASSTLKAWKKALSEGVDPSTKASLYKALKNEIFTLLFKYEILKIEEE